VTTNSLLKPNPESNKTDKNTDLNLNEIQCLIKNFNIETFYELTANEGEREDYEVLTILAIHYTLQKADGMSVLIYESKLQERRYKL
jgi:hypothetical protein